MLDPCMPLESLEPLNSEKLPRQGWSPKSLGSFPQPVTVLKGGLIKGLIEFLLPLVVTVTVRGNNPTNLLDYPAARAKHMLF